MFDKQIQFCDRLPDLFNNAIRDAFQENGFVIKEYITQKQLYDLGEDGNKVRLKGYTRHTIRLKIAKGQPADRTTLKDRGYFYANITVDANNEGFIIHSNVKYDVYLRKKYGKAIYIPSTSNMTEFVNKYVIPSIIEKLSPFLSKD